MISARRTLPLVSVMVLAACGFAWAEGVLEAPGDEIQREVRLGTPLKGFFGRDTKFTVHRIDNCDFPWVVPSFSMHGYSKLCAKFIGARERHGAYADVRTVEYEGSVNIRIGLYGTKSGNYMLIANIVVTSRDSIAYSSSPIIAEYDNTSIEDFVSRYFESCGDKFGVDWKSDNQ